MADGSWVGITNVHLLQELARLQIPGVGENTNSDCISILYQLFSNHSYLTTQDGRSLGSI